MPSWIRSRKGKALVAVVLGDRDDEPEVRLDHLLLGVEVAALDALGEVDLLLRGEQPRLADVLQEQLEAVRGHVRLEVDRGLLAAALAIDRTLLLGAVLERGVVLDQLDLGLFEEAVELLDVALVQVDLLEGGGHLGVGQYPGGLTLCEEELDLLQLLQFSYGHPFPIVVAGPSSEALAPFKQTNIESKASVCVVKQ